MRLVIDGKKRQYPCMAGLPFCNAPVYGCVSVLLQCEIDDGHFDLVFAMYAHRWDLIKHYRTIKPANAISMCEHRYAEQSTFKLQPSPLPVAIDGDTIKSPNYCRDPSRLSQSFCKAICCLLPAAHQNKSNIAILRSIGMHDDQSARSASLPAETKLSSGMRPVSYGPLIMTPILIVTGSFSEAGRYAVILLPKNTQPLLRPNANPALKEILLTHPCRTVSTDALRS